MLTEILPPHIPTAYAAMRELRPHLTSAAAFAEQVDAVQRPAGYRLVGAFDDAATTGSSPTGPPADAVAVIGFRVSTNLAWGRYVYVDDLSTTPGARRRGHARQLLEWVHTEAARLGCTQVHLDSGVGPTRQDAHRLYLNTGYAITAHHFTRTTPEAGTR